MHTTDATGHRRTAVEFPLQARSPAFSGKGIPDCNRRFVERPRRCGSRTSEYDERNRIRVGIPYLPGGTGLESIRVVWSATPRSTVLAIADSRLAGLCRGRYRRYCKPAVVPHRSSRRSLQSHSFFLQSPPSQPRSASGLPSNLTNRHPTVERTLASHDAAGRTLVMCYGNCMWPACGVVMD